LLLVEVLEVTVLLQQAQQEAAEAAAAAAALLGQEELLRKQEDSVTLEDVGSGSTEQAIQMTELTVTAVAVAELEA
jgi:hypothetical protein